MTVRTLNSAARIALPVLIAAFALPAFAEDVDFTTTGMFSCGTAVGCTTATFDGVANSQITFASNGNKVIIDATGYQYVDIPAGNPNLDDVNVMQFQDTGTNKNPVNTAGATFTLNFSQTAPTVGSGPLPGTITGSIDTAASTMAIAFSQTSLVLGTVTYTLDSDDWTIKNPGLNGNVGVTTDTATVTPEPTFMMLTGLGFAGLAFVAYRRRRTV